MNVFYLDHDQSVCASYHNDRHCVKMILEYAQLLCTAHREIDGDDCRWQDILYKSTHKNHPSAVWARESVANYNWLYKMFSELCKEYTFRYEKEHAPWTKLGHLLSSPPIHIPVGEFTAPTPAMPDECKIGPTSLESYRHYYNTEKRHLANWKNRPVPVWYE